MLSFIFSWALHDTFITCIFRHGMFNIFLSHGRCLPALHADVQGFHVFSGMRCFIFIASWPMFTSITCWCSKIPCIFQLPVVNFNQILCCKKNLLGSNLIVTSWSMLSFIFSWALHDTFITCIFRHGMFNIFLSHGRCLPALHADVFESVRKCNTVHCDLMTCDVM